MWKKILSPDSTAHKFYIWVGPGPAVSYHSLVSGNQGFFLWDLVRVQSCPIFFPLSKPEVCLIYLNSFNFFGSTQGLQMRKVSLCVLYCPTIFYMPCWRLHRKRNKLLASLHSRAYCITQLTDVMNLTVFESRWPKSEGCFIDD